MARFDIYKYPSKRVPYVVDVQADILSDLLTRVVVPLVPQSKARKEELPRLKPIIKINGSNYILMPTDIGVVPTDSLGDFVGNIEGEYRQTVVEALDFLFQGF